MINKLKEKIDSYIKLSELKIFSTFFVGNFFIYIITYAINFVVNKNMPYQDMGVFSYRYSLLNLFASVCTMEIYSAYLRFVSFYEEKSVIRTIRTVLSIGTILYLFTCFIVFKNYAYLLFIGYSWMLERSYLYRSKLKIKRYSLIKLSQHALLLLLLLIFPKMLTADLVLLFYGISYIVITLIFNLMDKFQLSKETEQLDTAKAKDIILYSFPLAFNAIVVWLLSSGDQYIIDRFLDKSTLSDYSVALRTVNIIRLFSGIFLEYWPKYYFDNMKNRKSVKNLRYVFYITMAAVSVGSIVFSGLIYYILGASNYIDSKWMFVLLVAAEFFRILGALNMTFRSYIKDNFTNIIILTIIGVAKIVANYLFVENLGIHFIIYSTLGIYVIYFISSFFFGLFPEKKYLSTAKQEE